jgi:hypothetical protein
MTNNSNGNGSGHNQDRDRRTRMMSHASEMYALLKKLVSSGADVRKQAAHLLHHIDSGQRSGADYSNLMPNKENEKGRTNTD